METMMHNGGQVLGMTIIHSLWEGLLIYLVWRLLLLCFPSLSAENKYRFALLALLGIAAGFAYTLYAEAQVFDWHSPMVTGSVPINRAATVPNPLAWTNHGKSTTLQIDRAARSLEVALKAYLPYIAVLYIVGLSVNLSLIGLAWNKIRVIKQSLMDARAMQATVDTFAARFLIEKKVRVSFSTLIDVPCVIGYLKPILLLPITLTTLLSAAEIEAILLHELSHIKNNDYLANLVQQIISILLFFNPFAKLIGRAISVERENRCDDWVVRITRTPLTYAHALVKLEDARQHELEFVLAATEKKNQLRARIERLMKPGQPKANIRHLVAAVLLFAGVAFCCFSFKTVPQTAFEFSGRIAGRVKKITLNYTDDQGKPVMEDRVTTDGSFDFTGHMNGARLAFISASDGKSKPVTARFFLEPGIISAAGGYADLANLVIKGSKAQVEYQAYQQQLAELSHHTEPLIAHSDQLKQEQLMALQNKDEQELDRITRQLAELNDQLAPYRDRYEQTDHDYINTHPDSYVSALELILYAKSWPVDAVKKMFANFSVAVQNSSYGSQLQKIILDMDNNAQGIKAKDFTAQGYGGEQVRLSDFKGRAVLLNFWGSAQPGLDNSPHLMHIFKRYHSLGLDMVGVADDDVNPVLWEKTIRQNGTGVWHQVLRGINNKGHTDIDDLFDVSALPTRILIAPDGSIAGRYIGTQGDAKLDKKLAELFDQRL